MTGKITKPSDYRDQVMAMFGHYGELLPLINRIEFPCAKWDRFAALREFYGRADLDLIDPYAVDWLKVFTPIEYLMWQDIRGLGIWMWPQYPVGRYFIDFADPKKRLGIECDGQHHDPQKDAKRDAELERLGWAIYRISGRDCHHERKGERLVGHLYGIQVLREEDEELAE